VASNEGFGSFRHLAVRFFGALDPRGPSESEERWAEDWLLPGERELWHRMSGPDRRHAAGVARETARLLGAPAAGPPAAGDQEAPAVQREVMASALLHDVGKVESGLGTFSRVGVTLAAVGLGRERLVAGDGQADGGGAGWRRRVSDYLCHDRIGADLLRQAGSHPATVAWAEEHHRAPERWTLDRRVADALKAADGD
jgi:hypothetical protein